MLREKYLFLLFILSFFFLSCDKKIIFNKKVINSGKVVINKKKKSICLKINKKIVFKLPLSQLTLILKTISISEKNNKYEKNILYQWELISNGQKKSGIKKSYIIYKKELNTINKVSKIPQYLLTKIKGSQKIQHGNFYLQWSYKNNNSIYLTYPSDLEVLNPKDNVSFLTPGKVLVNGIARKPTNILTKEPLPAKLQTNNELDDYFNLIKNNYNDSKFDDIYAMYTEWTKTNLTQKDNRKALTLRQKQYGKILKKGERGRF